MKNKVFCILIVLIIFLSPVLAHTFEVAALYDAKQFAYKINGIAGVPLLVETHAIFEFEDGSQGYFKLMAIPLVIFEMKFTSGGYETTRFSNFGEVSEYEGLQNQCYK